MTDFEKWSIYYKKKWASKEQLQKVVSYGVLTQEQYKQITEPQPTEE